MSRAVLFSNPAVAGAINAEFEAAWEGLPPFVWFPPTADGTPSRTPEEYGNSATFVCFPDDGTVADVLPGLMRGDVYRERLDEVRTLMEWADAEGREHRVRRLTDYHARQVQALGRRQWWRFHPAAGGGWELRREPCPYDLRNRREIDPGEVENDTLQAQTIRRRATHRVLAAVGPVPPHELSDRFYREVLQPDITDDVWGWAEYRER